MSVDKMESIAVLSPVEMNESSLRQLSPIEKLDKKEISSPIFQCVDADFYNFNNSRSLLSDGNDCSMDTFLSLPFSVDEVMEEGGAIVFQQAEEGEPSESASIKLDNSEDEEAKVEKIIYEDTNNILGDQTGKTIIKKKVYQCQEPGCDTWFVRASRFHEHIMMHNNVRPFHCSVCSYKTKWKSDVKKHIKKQLTKGDQTHADARLVISRDYEKDKLKKYNVFHVEKLIHCTDGSNKVPETGTSRNYVRDPSDPVLPPIVAAAPLVKSNGKNKNKKKTKKSSSKKHKVESNTSRVEVGKFQGNNTADPNPNEIQSSPVRLQTLPSLQNLLDLSQAQLSISDPILFRHTLPIPAQEFIHLVGFNKY